MTSSLHKLTFLVFLVFFGTIEAIEFGAKPPKVSSYAYNISYYPQRVSLGQKSEFQKLI